MDYGYSWLSVRSVDEERRIIEGIATTPAQARDGDVIVTKGIQFKLPIPFLWRHKDPFGNVVGANVSDDGISVRIQVGEQGISSAIDEQWRMVKAGIVRGLSIGWRTLEESFDKTIGGYRILKSEWVELSAVPVPADPNATITSVRSADEAILAALGRGNRRVNGHLQTAGVTAPKNGASKVRNFAEKITDLETKRAALTATMTSIMDKVDGDVDAMDETQKRDYDTAASELRELDGNLERYRAHQRAINTATPVPEQAGQDSKVAQAARGKRMVEEVKSNLPKGIGMARAVISLVQAKGNHHAAADLARRYYGDTPEVETYLRTAIAAGDTTTSGWASQLVPAAQQLQSEFLDLLRPATILGRINGLRRVPFNVAVPLQSGGGTYNWVGESKPKPVSKLTLGNATLRFAKCAGIIVITKELARFSSPSAEAIIRDDMVQGTARFLDGQFLSASLTETTDHPAGILKDVSAENPSGTSAAAFRYDLNVLMQSFISANQDPSRAVLLMSATTAIGLSLMTNAFGQPEFPNISINGGTVSGLPVIVSETVSDRVILLNASDILLADDGGVSIDISEQASIEMDDAPIGGEGSPIDGAVLHSLWQRNEIGLRVERFIFWKRARIESVAYTDNVLYAPDAPASPA